MPFPGTPDASPATRVIFSALAPSELRSVSALGSVSGRHAGHLIGLPDGSGTAFVPDHPFADAETVTVSAVLRSAADGTGSGAPRAKRLSFSFRVAAPVASSGATASSSSGPAPARARPAQTARKYPPTQHFHTVSGLAPAIVHATRNPDQSSGDIFLTPNNGHQNGPTILDSRGRLVWFDHIGSLSVYNLEVERYRGHPVLTWWEGKFAGGHGIDGTGVIMNTSYRIIGKVRAGNGYTSDLHEFQVTPQGTAWVDCYVPVHANLTSRGGSANGTVLDGVIQKIDIRTGRVLWEWHSLGHVPLSASYVGASGGGPYDYFHVNSIQELSTGKVLISARNTWGVYLIDERTGRIDWTLGGKHSSFRMGPGTQFAWQHHAILHRNGLLTLFDDAQVPPEPASSAEELRIKSGKVSLVRRDYHSPRIHAGYEGSAQLLPNGNMFVGWGDTRAFSEYSPGGHQIFNGSFLGPINSYRAYRFPWSGQPSAPPAIAVARGPHGALKVYSSWNGATGVARWRVLTGPARDRLRASGQATSSGFETGQRIGGDPRYIAVEALNAQGHVLARSGVLTRPAAGWA
jgi:arylsulfotransferase ASST